MSSVSFRGEDRARGILLLAGSLEDWGAFLTDVRGALMGKSPSGLAPGRKEPCEKCVAGVVKDRFGRESACAACEGRGWRWEDSGVRGVPVQTVGTKEAPTKAPRKRTCLDCDGDGVVGAGQVKARCKTCKGEGRIVADGFVLADAQARVEKDPLDRYEEAIARRDKSGSYREFVEVEAQVPFRALFRQVYVQVPPRPLLSLSEGERGQLRRAVRFMLEWMPPEVRVPRWVVEADARARAQPVPKGRGVSKLAREERDAIIVRRFINGEAVKAIAQDMGLSVGRVNEIVYQEREVA